jgi:hypothetical protein
VRGGIGERSASGQNAGSQGGSECGLKRTAMLRVVALAAAALAASAAALVRLSSAPPPSRSSPLTLTCGALFVRSRRVECKTVEFWPARGRRASSIMSCALRRPATRHPCPPCPPPTCSTRQLVVLFGLAGARSFSRRDLKARYRGVILRRDLKA